MRYLFKRLLKLSRFIFSLGDKNINNEVHLFVPTDFELDDEELKELMSRLNFYAPHLNNSNIKINYTLPYLSILKGASILIWVKIENQVLLNILNKFNNIFFVNHLHYVAAWDYVRFSNYFHGHKVDRKKSIRTFRKSIELLPKKKCSYVFGTGPSLSAAINHDFSNGLVIVCNTIVRDTELFNKLKPTFLVAGDALYHFSNTDHAYAFRRDLLQRMIETDVIFVYPEMFDFIVQRELTPVKERLIPIPIGKHKKLHVNLTMQFELPNAGNVLPLLQLPLACTVTSDVRLWGFDGRSPDDVKSSFWLNSNKHSYPELMHTLKSSYPLFFELNTPNNDSKKYIESVHGEFLNERLESAESEGFSFKMLHHSWTQTFAKRYNKKFEI